MRATEQLDRLYSRILDTPQELDLDQLTLDDFSQHLISLAHEHDFVVHSTHGSQPQLVLIGITHKSGMVDQENELVHILQHSMQANDMLLYENSDMQDVYEVDYPGYHRNDVVGQLKNFLMEKDIRVVMNDARSVRGSYMLALSRYNNCKQNGTVKEELAEQLLDAREKRDRSFCYHPSAGIVPLAKRTAKIYKQPEDDARLFQVFGLGHLIDDNITSYLKQEDISFIAFEPLKK